MAKAEWIGSALDDERINALMTELHVTRPTAAVLANRGLDPDSAGAYLRPRLGQLCDPYLLGGTETAARRIWEAIEKNQRILVHGDYDTDGITSTVLLRWVLGECGANVDWFVPNRIDDGYGLGENSVAHVISEGYNVVITVDCGIGSVEAAKALAEAGVELIITDHHEPGPELPKALAVINPKLHEDLLPLHSLAGVGVSFKLCHAVVKYGRQANLGGFNVDLREGLDLVALGTVADIVPLLGENRCMVRHGMQVLQSQRRPGIRALCEQARIDQILKARDISFRLAPRLNAAGRLGDAGEAIKLLGATSIVEAHDCAAVLEKYNRQRQEREEETYNSAIAQIEAQDLSDRFTIVAAGDDWHPGVLGIVAARLVRKFNRPSVVLSLDPASGELQGSGRSVGGVNLVLTLDKCAQHLGRYGGHPMAAGVGVLPGQLDPFKETFEQTVRQQISDLSDFVPTLQYDSHVDIADLNDRFFEELDSLQPFGHGNPAPVFRMTGVRVEQLYEFGRGHCRGTVSDPTGRQLPFIAFGRTQASLPRTPWDAAVTPFVNRFRGNAEPTLQLVDLRNCD
jgi:single-stranded-DNA-specific exonuclease